MHWCRQVLAAARPPRQSLCFVARQPQSRRCSWASGRLRCSRCARQADISAATRADPGRWQPVRQSSHRAPPTKPPSICEGDLWGDLQAVGPGNRLTASAVKNPTHPQPLPVREATVSFVNGFGGVQGRICFDHGVHDREQFAHAGDDDDLGGLSGHFEALRKGLDCRIASHRGHRGHVQDGSDIGAAAPDEALSAMLAAVVCQRRDAHQFGDFAPIELAQFRTFGQHSRAGDCRPRRECHAADRL